jgi:hypothetical protein
MKFFNAMQLVGVFAAVPFLFIWLSNREDYWAKPLCFALSILYAIGFIYMTAIVADDLEKH